MGLLERIRTIFGGTALVDYPAHVRDVSAGRLDTYTVKLDPDTDESRVVLTIDAPSLRALSPLDAPVRLWSPSSEDVTFVPVRRAANPALDPNLGWIIPVTPDAVAELSALTGVPGEYDLASLHLSLIVSGS
ncbi:hypothetical protein CAPI_07290 [Corynebacterium capitovis DSM 44611]|uniref:hypothetical protein n=1 Tax=Corynebacterium capitovis TaxID=131081 RepID=UPI00036E983A|nr:hypothetical protein [Corynebacterium capitovis]WKD57996.1 hypothetical protein CAPI_07290 [Corynebacterium capitovis DSM 44611]